jgi:hypothetical protein
MRQPAMQHRMPIVFLCRAALQCVSKCLNRLCSALGSFHLLKPSGYDLFALLQRVTSSKTIDGSKLQGLNIGGLRLLVRPVM